MTVIQIPGLAKGAGCTRRLQNPPVERMEKGGYDVKPSEIRHRLADPSGFDADSYRRKELTDGVSLVMGKRPGRKVLEPQSLRFDRKKFSADEAKTWVKEHWTQKDIDAALAGGEDGTSAHTEDQEEDAAERRQEKASEDQGEPRDDDKMPEIDA